MNRFLSTAAARAAFLVAVGAAFSSAVSGWVLRDEVVLAGRFFDPQVEEELVARPLKLNFRANPERLARLEDERAFKNLAVSKKKKADLKAEQEAAGRAQQEAIRELLAGLPDTLYRSRPEFVKILKAAAKEAGVKLATPIRNPTG